MGVPARGANRPQAGGMRRRARRRAAEQDSPQGSDEEVRGPPGCR